ncbi:MAG TPA: AAA family ATPase [Gaiellaceae bacterium]|nr:AAA family ATPase [Gaiellaceae bacterium]
MICAQCAQENPDGFRFCGNCGAALVEAAPARELRKTVTVLFCDVSGSTALGERTDPEALRHVMRRYFDEIRASIERHGGTVEKFVGDAAMAVFGVPQVREDDALRAVRAADEIRARLPRLAEELGVALAFRTGINTGEVVVGEGQTLATGDAVNVAARLEQAADPGEILLGVETRRLVRDAVEVEPVEPLALKGKSRPVAAFRLLSVDPDAPALARRFDAPLVGREQELRLLRHAFERAVGERSCSLVTVLGAAGVGKSRLVAEFLAGVEGEARVVRGRCLHYGEGITFWPLVEALKQLGADAEPVLERLVEGGVASPAELFWEVRKLLERFAQERPLVAVFDDVHWAQPMLLDLLDHVADLSREAPILLLCVARPELLDERPGWGGGKLNATATLLEALSAEESERLLDALGDGLDPAARARIVEASEGNPLFVEEMAALAREDGGAAVPSTIQALLAARLDRLGADERAVIERGAVEGKIFHRAAVRELAPEPVRPEVETHLAALVRKELIRPERGPLPDDDAFRFRHLLIRDAAYESLPKEARAELHEGFADWLEAHGAELVERDEIVGYHLEQAVRYRRELGAAASPETAARAARLLAAAGRRARSRCDSSAAVNLLGRAIALLPPGDERARLLVQLASMCIVSGDLAAAERALDEADRASDEAVRAYARACRFDLILHADPQALEERQIRETIETLERLGHEEGLALAWRQLCQFHWLGSRAGPAAAALERSNEYARAVGDRFLELTAIGQLMGALIFGPTPAGDVRRRLDELANVHDDPYVYRLLDGGYGELALLRGDLEEARRRTVGVIAHLHEHGAELIAIAHAQQLGRLELVAGNAAEAERVLREGCERLAALGDRAYRSTTVVTLAVVLEAEGRLDEAEQAALEAEELSAAEDAINFAQGRAVRARVLLARGDAAAAEELGRSAVEHADRTDFPVVRGDARLAHAEALAACGRRDEAAAAAAAALSLFELKEHASAAAAARALLAGLERSPA